MRKRDIIIFTVVIAGLVGRDYLGDSLNPPARMLGSSAQAPLQPWELFADCRARLQAPQN
jgi:hypothetical protein